VAIKRKSTKRRAQSASKRGSGKREALKGRSAIFYAKRTSRGPLQGDGRAWSGAGCGSTPQGEESHQSRLRRSGRSRRI